MKRIVASVIAGLGLAVLPTAASAYEAPVYDVVVSDATPAPGAPFTVKATGAEAGEQLTLTVTSPASIPDSSIQVAGSQALPKTATADGEATWTVTLSSAGTYTLTITDGEGGLVGEELVTVAAAPADPGSSLSSTGFDPAPLALGAGGLVLLGGAVLIVARRRAALV